MTLYIRSVLDKLTPYRTGGVAVLRREAGAGDPLVQLAQNEGIYGPLPSARWAVEATTTFGNRYPEGDFGMLRRALAERYDVPYERVFVAGGSTAVMHYLSMCLLEPGDEVVFGDPSFLAYRLEALKMGAVPVPVPLSPDGSFDPAALLDAVTARTKLVYLANPNNPTGGMITRRKVAAFLDRLPGHVLPVLDEAYFEYVDQPDYPDGIREFAIGERPVAVLRTFSKIYGLAGLRVGFGVLPEELVQAAMSAQVPFEVNTLGLAAALASLDAPEEEITRRRTETCAGRERLVHELARRGLAHLPSVANFVQVRVGDANAVATALEREGVLIRSLAPWGVPDSIRVTIGAPDEIDAFLAALSRVTAVAAGRTP